MFVASLSDQLCTGPLPTQRHFIRWTGEFLETGLVEGGKTDGVVFVAGEGEGAGCSSVGLLDTISVHVQSRLTVDRLR